MVLVRMVESIDEQLYVLLVQLLDYSGLVVPERQDSPRMAVGSHLLLPIELLCVVLAQLVEWD